MNIKQKVNGSENWLYSIFLFTNLDVKLSISDILAVILKL